MLNAEKFKEEILSINDVFGVYDGEPVTCCSMFCEDCEFSHRHSKKTCAAARINWMLSEYEPPKIEPEIYNLKCDDKIEVSSNGKIWFKRYFKEIKDEQVIAWANGTTSFSKSNDEDVSEWKFARIPREE